MNIDQPGKPVWPGDRLLAPALFVLGFCRMFAPVFAEGFRRTIGDGGDGLILIATLEHWFNVLQGQPVGGTWRDTGSFYPTPGTLGFTDNYFAYAVPYCLLRLASVESLTAYTMVIALFATVGYWSMFLLCRSWPRGMAGTAAIGAFVFSFGAAPVFKLVHAQTYTIMLAPLVGLLLVAAWRERRHIWVKAVPAGLVTGLILFSAAQSAWFLGWVGMLATLYWVARTRPRLAALGAVAPLAAGFAAGLAIAFIPTAMLYLNGLGLRHERSFAEAKGIFAPFIFDLIQVPPGNLLWFDFEKFLGIAGRSATRALYEVALGYTPVFLCLTVGGAVFLRRRARAGPAKPDDLLAEAFVAAAILGWLIELNYFGLRPWWLVYHLVPGASAIRTPFRVQLAGLFFMCLAFSHIAARLLALAGRPGQPIRALVTLGALLALCVVEQLGAPAEMRQSAEVESWLSVATPPPFPCDAFYVVPMPNSSQKWWAHQSDAMMLSQKIHLPTLNGNSSWYPEGWGLMHPEAPDYARNVIAWAKAHQLDDHVCGVDPRAGTWVRGLPEDGS